MIVLIRFPEWGLIFRDRDPYHVYMAYAGSVPHQGLTHVRIHRMLNIIGVEWRGAEPSFDWERFDAATDLLRRYGLNHHFEFDLKGRGRGAPKIKEATREATAQVDSEIDHIKRLREAFPRYAGIPFVNTEHDPWNGWGKARCCATTTPAPTPRW